MTIEKTPNGILIYDLLNGYMFQRFFIGYSITQAKKLFRSEYKTQKIKEQKQ